MKQFFKFLLVGLFNTAFGYCIIFFCMYAIQISPELSNVIGYLIALGVSYALNRRFTFESKQRRSTEMAKFLLVFCVAYTVNFCILLILIHHLKIEKGVSQILAGVFYVGVSFIMNKYYAFRSNTQERH